MFLLTAGRILRQILGWRGLFGVYIKIILKKWNQKIIGAIKKNERFLV